MSRGWLTCVVTWPKFAVAAVLACAWWGGVGPALLLSPLLLLLARSQRDPADRWSAMTAEELLALTIITLLCASVGLAGAYRRRVLAVTQQHAQKLRDHDQALSQARSLNGNYCYTYVRIVDRSGQNAAVEVPEPGCPNNWKFKIYIPTNFKLNGQTYRAGTYTVGTYESKLRASGAMSTWVTTFRGSYIVKNPFCASCES